MYLEESKKRWLSKETGALLFAVFNIIVVILTTAVAICFLIYQVVDYTQSIRYGGPTATSDINFLQFYKMIVTMTVLMFSMIGIVFGSFLVNGIRKKKPEHIKAYYVYGIVVVALPLLSSSLCALSAEDYECSIEFFFVFCLYCSILRMIRNTYLMYQIRNQQFDHKLLIEGQKF